MRAGQREELEAPDPIEHAAPDVELAEAQLAVGRPEAAEPAEPEAVTAVEEAELEEEAAAEAPPERESAAGERLPAPRARAGTRLVQFAQGSWRELQRVQWPDRRQVMQATSVVVGFVIIAGAFLGIADFVAGKLVNYILTGHFK